jgi:glycosyltransferase involved in cell wall biosynthesis
VAALWAERDVIGTAREVLRFANLALIIDDACVRSGPIDVIHVHNAGIRGMCAYAVAKRLDVPLAITVYSSEFGDEVANVPLAARCCERADSVIGISQFCLDMVKEAGVDRPVSLVYCGTDYDRFRPDIDTSGIRAQYGVGPEDVLILTAGWLSYRKGQDLLVEAAAQLAKEQRLGNARILICGPSSPNDPLVENLEKRIAESGMEQRVQLVGEVSADDLVKLYATADVFVFPTRLRTEGFGLVAAEAMACGTPVVASRVGAIPEVVRDGKTGLLFEPDDAGDLAEKLGALLDDPDLRAEFASNAPKHVRKHFSWEEAAQLLEAIYRQCLEERR